MTGTSIIYIGTDLSNFLDLQTVTFDSLLSAQRHKNFVIVSAYSSDKHIEVCKRLLLHSNVLSVVYLDTEHCNTLLDFDVLFESCINSTFRYSEVFIAGTPMFTDVPDFSEKAFNAYNNLIENGGTIDKVSSINRITAAVKATVFLYYVIKRADVVKHFVLDPNESEIMHHNCRQYFFMPSTRFRYMPIQLHNIANSIQSDNTIILKYYYFCMGMTSFKNEYRQNILTNLLQISDDRHKIVGSMYDIRSGEKTFDKVVSRTEYLQLLSQSATTLIISSYNSNFFSGLRFIEAIAAGCVPLIESSAAYKTMCSAEIDKIIEEHLIVKDINSIQNHIQYAIENRVKILQLLKETEYYRTIKSSEYINRIIDIENNI